MLEESSWAENSKLIQRNVFPFKASFIKATLLLVLNCLRNIFYLICMNAVVHNALLH